MEFFSSNALVEDIVEAQNCLHSCTRNEPENHISLVGCTVYGPCNSGAVARPVSVPAVCRCDPVSVLCRSFWELDPTEGYLRQRSRLRRTRLQLASRFFQPSVAPRLGENSAHATQLSAPV